MSDENRRAWYRNPTYLAVIVAIVAIVVSIIVWQCPIPSRPDFSISVNPMVGSVEQDGVTQTLVTVEGIHRYKHPVSLSANEQPSGIIVTFIPLGGPTPAYDSTVTMRVKSNVPPGDYPIIIKGAGADGTEHTCTYTLTVIEPAPVTPPPPAPAAFQITKLSIDPAEVKPGDKVTITAEVINTGGTGGSYTVELKINGATEATQEVTLAAGASQVVSFTLSKDTPGTYKVTLGVLAGDFVVAEPPTPSLKITYPPSGGRVEIREIVRGTSQDILKEQAIWIVIYPHEVSRYYPQDYPADVQANGDWSSSVFIGIEIDVGKKFDIIAVLADKKAQDAFNDYLEECKEKRSWPGLESLHEDAVIYDRITVIRR